MKKLKQKIQWLKFIAAPCLLLLVLSSSCSKDKDNNPQGGNSYPKEVEVEYRLTSVRGITSGDVIYHNSTGGNTLVDKVTLPYSVKFKRTVNFTDNLAISINALGSGEVKAEILVDGKVVTTQNYAGTSVITGAAIYIFQ
ncbi:hypothetical protein [Pedobacter antarcticus]|uniref:Lipoprotein n=2 Tax=Pedobacter antarcticus TaxID=34086 RepID=A0A081PGK5_9SPHI|nr:hypothetical protein [Pedobacter antarcticus]KEQ29828.1 hypothetical protein N180_06205 [Pedobacter antarcticus 4BY]SDM50798.1 hypothetical protein SAMN04488084_107184 [Pedobacter antarcticus]SFE67077.1 hypothetical protein SAMN03003324_01044 [Pedobacter antarcticus]